MSTCLAGVSAGRMNPKGTASLKRNSGSPVVRWNVIWLPLTSMPLERSHDFGVLMHASAPWMTLYQLPAFGLSPILKRRSKVALTSAPVTVLPLENLIPSRRVNAYVLPLSVGVGTSVARSGTSFVPSAPPTRLNPTSPSCVMIRNCHSWSVEFTCGSGETEGAAFARVMSARPLAPAVSAEPDGVDDEDEPPPSPLLVVLDELPHAAARTAIATTMAASKVERFT